MKRCGTCGQEKEPTEYNKNKSKSDGLNTICKVCSNKMSKEYYKQNTEKQKKVVLERNKRHRETLRDFMTEFLLTKKCTDCGIKDIRVLEFDHLPEYKKDKDISIMMGASYSLDRIKKEIDKCEVVCSNCHRIRSYERRPSYKSKNIHQ